MVSDPLIVEIAKRNMRGVVPLYYEARKANAVHIDGEQIFKGLEAAWKGGKIGLISNEITKIWNSDVWTSDDEEAKKEAETCIKYLCMINNYTIDYAKTLYMPDTPTDIQAMISKYTKHKTPHFFLYAKDKKEHQVEEVNNTTVNKLDNIIKNPKLNFRKDNIGKCQIRYMMRDWKIDVDQDFIAKYDELNKQYHFKLNNNRDESNIEYIVNSILEELDSFGYTRYEQCDMLIKYLFQQKQSKHKKIFWSCYGDIVVNNLKLNIPKGSVCCSKCNKRFVPDAPNQHVCPECQTARRLGYKTVVCADCGTTFTVHSKNTKSCRCEACSIIYKRKQTRKRVQNHRQQDKNVTLAK